MSSGLAFRSCLWDVLGLGFRVQGFGVRVQDSGLRVSGGPRTTTQNRAQGPGMPLLRPGVGHRVSGFGYRVSELG